MATTENGSREQLEVTSASSWKGKRGTELKLPSGNVCLVRNPGVQSFLKSGIIPDPLASAVRKAISGNAEFNPRDLIKTEEDLDKAFEVFDAVLLAVVIEPRVEPVPMRAARDEHGNVFEDAKGEEVREPVPFTERDEDTLYVDEVDLDDKVFIFQFAVGGTRDLEQFRAQQNAMLESVRTGKDLEGAAQ